VPFRVPTRGPRRPECHQYRGSGGEGGGCLVGVGRKRRHRGKTAKREAAEREGKYNTQSTFETSK
jgi:hypothetical protein